MADLKIPILLDTDPGSDIDDALAIAYLLSQPRCEFLGITTVTGKTDERAGIADLLCRVAGRSDVPIYPGIGANFVHGRGQPQVPHFTAIKDRTTPKKGIPSEAIDFLRSTIRSRPGEITLLSIGPFQNIAALFAIDPEIPSLLKSFVSMAGAFRVNDQYEWNCIVDPVATMMVIHAPRVQHDWYGLDVTLQCATEKEDVYSRFKGGLLETVLQMATKWFEHTGQIIWHDPLAAATIFEPQLCQFESGRVTAEIMEGKTTFTAGEGIDRIATAVDVPAFFDHFFSVVKPSE